MMNTSTSNPTLKDLARALRVVAPALSVVFTVAFLIGFTAKLVGFLGVQYAATPIAMVALVGLYRKRAGIRCVLLEQVASRSMATNA